MHARNESINTAKFLKHPTTNATTNTSISIPVRSVRYSESESPEYQQSSNQWLPQQAETNVDVIDNLSESEDVIGVSGVDKCPGVVPFLPSSGTSNDRRVFFQDELFELKTTPTNNLSRDQRSTKSKNTTDIGSATCIVDQYSLLENPNSFAVTNVSC
ncbi:unnamed protein product [Thelazia callipaeda]|uniref:Uncharacterized protein n=1 Tax=Thelazia callipaeda TaxID=103827 RepID=A0A0N5CRW3_THECL|nr:unnamed protein product [Thelazia callipaeda]